MLYNRASERASCFRLYYPKSYWVNQCMFALYYGAFLSTCFAMKHVVDRQEAIREIWFDRCVEVLSLFPYAFWTWVALVGVFVTASILLNRYYDHHYGGIDNRAHGSTTWTDDDNADPKED